MSRVLDALSVRGLVATCVWLLACKVSAVAAVEIVRAPQNSLCARGYQHRGGSMCVPLVVPANAHVDSSGHDWECNAGYRRKGKLCERMKAPDVAAARENPRKIVAPPERGDHRDASRDGSPDILRRRLAQT